MAANALVRFITTKAAKLSSLEVRDGQIIFVSDTRHIFLDFNGGRICYECIATLPTEQERLSLLAPVVGFYYVAETSIIWNYDVQGWHQLTPDTIEQVVIVSEYEDLPQTGNPKQLYVTDNATYKWDDVSRLYKMVANLTAWEELQFSLG